MFARLGLKTADVWKKFKSTQLVVFFLMSVVGRFLPHYLIFCGSFSHSVYTVSFTNRPQMIKHTKPVIPELWDEPTEKATRSL